MILTSLVTLESVHDAWPPSPTPGWTLIEELDLTDDYQETEASRLDEIVLNAMSQQAAVETSAVTTRSRKASQQRRGPASQRGAEEGRAKQREDPTAHPKETGCNL